MAFTARSLAFRGGNRIRGVRAIDACPVAFWSLAIASEIYTQFGLLPEKNIAPPVPGTSAITSMNYPGNGSGSPMR